MKFSHTFRSHYTPDDCIPPHIDHTDFARPFCTLSLLSEAPIVFGTTLRIVSEGVFEGSFSLPLPTGSVLVINGPSADVAKHAIPSVKRVRISITFRKVGDAKRAAMKTATFKEVETRVLTEYAPSQGQQQAAVAAAGGAARPHAQQQQQQQQPPSMAMFPPLGGAQPVQLF